MKLRFEVRGMTCAACSARVEKVTKSVPGVKSATVNLLAGTMIVEADNDQCSGSIISSISTAGYSATLQGEKKPVSPEGNKLENELQQTKIRIIISAVCLIILMYFTMGHMFHLPMPYWYVGRENALVAALLQFVLTLPPVVLNRSYFTRGLKALWHRSPNMDSLIAVGSGASLLYGIVTLFLMAFAIGHGQWETVEHFSKNLYFESAAMILTLITIGKFLETRAKGKTGDAIRQLMDLSPKTANVRRDNVEITIPVEQVALGDIIIIRSGASIPVDGTVVSGRAAVDQSALTGESIPVEKLVNDTVSAATVVSEGYLEIRAERIGQDTTLAQIIRLVEDAGGSKAPIARLADKIAGIFVPVVMTISAITLVFWLISGAIFSFALSNAICVLVISCPCALGLATPVAIMVGSGRGAKMGVLYKNAEAVENLHRIDTVVLDKTGTLTQGKPQVTDVIAYGRSRQELLRIACSLEKHSEHPFAKAIVNISDNIPLADISEFTTLPGQGVSAMIEGKKYYGGNFALMQSLGIAIPEFPELTCAGKTPMYFASAEGELLGIIAAADVLKFDAFDAVAQLKKLGLNVIMLTGDNANTAKAIAEKAGIADVIADVLPTEKAGTITRLRSEGRKVLMVGDGINDAPALALADVGMAIGAGTDIAIESADVVLMSKSLMSVASAIALSKATMNNIRQNLFWAFFYNSLGIPIAAGVLFPMFGVLLSPMIGAAAMSLSSFFVVSNALRLRLFKAYPEVTQHETESKQIVNIQEEKNMENVIKVNGMMCPHCKARVESVCKAVEGTTDAVVDLEKKQVTVLGNANIEALKRAIREAGYEVI